MPSVIYSFISRGSSVLLEANNKNFGGNFRDTAVKLLKEQFIASMKEKEVYPIKGYTFNFKRVDDIYFLCMADEAFGKGMPFVFLGDLSQSFDKHFPITSTVDELSVKSFMSEYDEKMVQYSNPADSDKVTQVEKELGDVKDIMSDNFEKAMARNENLDILTTKTEDLHLTSVRMKKASTTLRQNLCWSNIKLKLILCCTLVFILYIFTASFCGLDLSYCYSS